MKVLEWELAEPLPTKKLKDPFNIWMPVLNQHPPGTAMLILRQPNEARREAVSDLFGLTMGSWNVALHWVFKKKWISKHRIPASRSEQQEQEPFGEHLFRLLELTVQVDLINATPYPSCAAWFCCIVQEMQRNEQIALTSPPKKNQGKESAVQELRAIAKSLKAGYNPYCPTAFPNLALLINLALEVSSDFDKFYSDYWHPYIKSLSDWANAVQKNPNIQAIRLEDDTLQYQSGQGRHRVKFQLAKNALPGSLAP